jgi:Ca2+-binding RTX toxin-like protein
VPNHQFATAQAETFFNYHDLVQYWESATPGQNSVQVLKTYDYFDFNFVDYSNSPSAVFIDTEKSVQHGGFAEGDVLTNIGHIIGSNSDDIIRGSDPLVTTNDGVLNDPGVNHLEGGFGNDILEGRGGGDTLDGGGDLDTASYESSPAGVHVTVNDPTTGAFLAYGGDATGDKLISIENLTGSAHDDTLIGASNDNFFIGGLGNDSIDGAGGIDTVSYATETIDKVLVNLSLGSASEMKALPVDHSFASISLDHLYHIENVIGTSGDDQIIGSSADNVLDGGLGNDYLDGLGGNDTASFLSWDSLAPSSGGNTYLSLQSTNITLGSEVDGGSATRSVFSPSTMSFHTVEQDTLLHIENVTGSNLAESITGDDSDNIIYGRGGNDTIDGGGGNDTLDGGADINTVSFMSRDGFITAGEVDSITLGRNNGEGYAQTFIETINPVTKAVTAVMTESDTLSNFTNVIGSNHGEGIDGNEVANVINGRGGDDTINGWEGNDTINGGDGNDRLIGYTGADTLTGGAGHDNFLFFSSSDSHFGAGQFDTITDFEQGSDKIDFHYMDANTGLTGKQSFIFDTGNGPLDVGHVHASYDAIHNVTVVEANTIGQGHALDFHLELTGPIALTASDFILG